MPVALPHLKRVTIGGADEEDLFEISSAFLLAYGVLVSQPHIESLSLFLEEPHTEAVQQDIGERINELVGAALTRNLRTLVIEVGGQIALRLHWAVRYGWLKCK